MEKELLAKFGAWNLDRKCMELKLQVCYGDSKVNGIFIVAP